MKMKVYVVLSHNSNTDGTTVAGVFSDRSMAEDKVKEVNLGRNMNNDSYWGEIEECDLDENT